jgi:predicted Ser/Thr protein kinase
MMIDRKNTPSLAETVASSSLAGSSGGAASAASAAGDISRVVSSIEDEGRFLPGTLLGGRYRIIELLGRGGMGEVYRATDLTLGQSVALKFLPEEASKNQRLLERFHGEVRVARLVSHPNVCRVYDIGEVEGMPFISMEYIDGEDLASLLTRIGRLPSDKAIETARKLCAGLAAAHDRGVIHRDLKPQNIMMNKRGEVLIMDFGLAAIADQLNGPEARNGTPAYMSPEQLRGEAVTAKSDIYALGLVLYELFTGKRPYDAGSVQQLIDMQQSMHLTSVTSMAADVDPAVEKVIRRCLDPDPMRRPANALGIVAALPGGDPLTAALAAGETPSPEMVAAAGTVQGMPRKYSIPLLAITAACLIAVMPLREARTALIHSSMERSPEVLAHESRSLAVQFGYTDRPADSAVWLNHRPDLMNYLKKLPTPHKWDEWYAAESPIRSIYRESPRPLNALPDGRVTSDNPPPTLPGMLQVNLDGNGRLLVFDAVPNDGAPAFPNPVPPDAVFRASGLDLTKFREIDPAGVPPNPFDSRRAWKGPHPKLPNTELRVDVAWWKGRITRARVYYPWSTDTVAAQPPQSLTARIRGNAIWVLQAIGAFFVILLARHNWKRNRADTQGAWRIAAARFLLGCVAWIGWTHPMDNESMIDHFLAAASDWLFSAAILWLLYLALEPAVRARWPHSIVTWNRVLTGRWGDPQVWSDVLVGAAAGSMMWMVFKALNFIMETRGEFTGTDVSLNGLNGTPQWIGVHATDLGSGLFFGLLIFLAIFGMRRMLRRDWLAVPAASLLFTLMQGGIAGSADWVVLTILYVAVYGTLIILLLRWGLISAIVTIFFVNSFNNIPLGADWKTWYTPYGLATFLMLLGIACFAFWRSLGGRELIGEEGAA